MSFTNTLIGVLASQNEAVPLTTLAHFVLDNTSMSYTDSVRKDADFDTIREQSGFSPVLSGTVTSITAPTGATRLVCSCWTGSGSSTGNYFELALYKNGSLINGFIQMIHGGFYSANHISGVVNVSGGDTISVSVNADHTNSCSIVFAGKFY